MERSRLLVCGLTACVVVSLTSFARAACPLPGKFQAVDLAVPVDQGFITKMHELGVDTVIRYYDHKNEAVSGKTLTRKERDLISANGLNLMVVFQHQSAKLESFTPVRGRQDAKRAVQLARNMAQPKGSALYFSVDGNWGGKEEIKPIRSYFQAARTIARNSGYKIGGYASGAVCDSLLDAGLVDFCWLANTNTWPGYRDFNKSDRWAMKQFPKRTCEGREASFSNANRRIPDYGQFE